MLIETIDMTFVKKIQKNIFLFVFVLCNVECDSQSLNLPKIYNVGTLISNAYLIKGDKNILIDTGVRRRGTRVKRKMKRHGVSPNDLSIIIITHGHSDHAAGAGYFQKNYHVPVIVGEGDVKLVEQGINDSLIIATPKIWLGKIIKKYLPKTYPAFKPDFILKPEDTFNLNAYGVNGTVKLMPGHTKGSVVVLLKTDAFVGDDIRGSLLFPHNPRIHYFHQNKKKALENVMNLINQGYVKFYVGHGGPLKATSLTKKYQK